MRTLHFCACAVALAGCVEAEERSTNFNYLHAAIIEPACATIGCHSEATKAAGPTFMEVDLSAPGIAYSTISGVECGSGDTPGVLTVESASEDGVTDFQLMHILLGRRYVDRFGTPAGEPEIAQMPPDFPLPPADLALIRQWLEAGAPCE
jgi:hypothetical protein